MGEYIKKELIKMKLIIDKRYLLSEYNKRVKKEYKVNKNDAYLLQEEAKRNAQNNGCNAYIEIPRYMTKSNCTEIISQNSN